MLSLLVEGMGAAPKFTNPHGDLGRVPIVGVIVHKELSHQPQEPALGGGMQACGQREIEREVHTYLSISLLSPKDSPPIARKEEKQRRDHAWQSIHAG